MSRPVAPYLDSKLVYLFEKTQLTLQMDKLAEHFI